MIHLYHYLQGTATRPQLHFLDWMARQADIDNASTVKTTEKPDSYPFVAI